MPANYLTHISIGTPDKQAPILLPLKVPEKQNNQLIVLAGKNRSGKSYIISQADQSIKEHNKLKNKLQPDKFTPRRSSVAVALDRPAEQCEGVFMLNDLDWVLKKFTNISLNDERRKISPFHIENLCRKTLHGFILPHLQCRFKTELDIAQWQQNKEYRIEFCQQWLDPSKLYKCAAPCEVTETMEKMAEGHLYYRFNAENNYLELHLNYFNGQVFSNPSWSQGQRALFFYLCFIIHHKINILMIDEIESYLHPEYITLLCEKLKDKIPQCIVTTHHPHVIFSKIVDQCWYIELEEPKPELPAEIIDFQKKPKDILPSFARRVINLDSEFSKISMTYKLFDGYDNNLLRLSHSNALSLSESVIDSFTKAFDYGAIKQNKSHRPDLQNDKLALFIKEAVNAKNQEKLRVLDLGAGLGRTFFEVTKVSGIVQKVHWSFWEPFDSVREALKNEVADLQNVEVIALKDNILTKYYDLVVISNVLHECNPDDFAQMITTAAKACVNSGTVIVIELHPLLHPEKYAVPYTKENMKKILRKSGFAVESTAINIRNASVNAYWVKARPEDNIEFEKVKAAVQSEWADILAITCGDYRDKPTISTPEHVVQVMGELTTIASIQSYNQGEWR